MNESCGTLCYTEFHIFVCYSAEMGFFFLKSDLIKVPAQPRRCFQLLWLTSSAKSEKKKNK